MNYRDNVQHYELGEVNTRMLKYLNLALAQLVSRAAVQSEEGQMFAEFALLVAFSGLVAVLGATILGNSISSLFNSVAGSI